MKYSYLFFLFLSLFLSFSFCIIYQSSSPDQIAIINFTSYLKGGEYECNTLLAKTTLTIVITTITFNGNKVYSSFPYDMFLLINDERGVCLQYGGYNENVEGCLFVNEWPSTWKSHNPGTYYAIANFSSYNLQGTTWEVCIGNGYIQEPTPDPDDVYYNGQFNFTSSLITTSYVPSNQPTGIPTSIPSISFQPTDTPITPTTPAPSISIKPTFTPTLRPTTTPSISMMPTTEPFILESTCNTFQDSLLTINFDTALSGKEKVCSDFFSFGYLKYVNITLQFSGSKTKEYPYDMLLEIYLIDIQKGLQIGGFDQQLPDITYVSKWPDSWKSTKDGTYKAIINVTSYGLNGTGNYQICMMNGWKFGKKVSYSGLLLLPSLYIDCPSWPPTFTPTFLPTFFSNSPTIISLSSSPTLLPTMVISLIFLFFTFYLLLLFFLFIILFYIILIG